MYPHVSALNANASIRRVRTISVHRTLEDDNLLIDSLRTLWCSDSCPRFASGMFSLSLMTATRSERTSNVLRHWTAVTEETAPPPVALDQNTCFNGQPLDTTTLFVDTVRQIINLNMNLTLLKMRRQKEKVTKAINRKVNKLMQPRSVDHVHLMEDHLESVRSPVLKKNAAVKEKNTKKSNQLSNKKATDVAGDHTWGRKEKMAAQRESQVKKGKLDSLRAELQAKIEALKNKRMGKSGKTPQKKHRESKKVRREKNRNKSGLGSERSDAKNKHKLMKLAASKMAHGMSNHQLLIDESDSD